MTSRRLFALFASLLVCVTAHANTIPTGVASAPNATDLNLLACHVTLAGLTILGMFLSARLQPGAMIKAGATHR